jgi:hypothetical protein
MKITGRQKEMLLIYYAVCLEYVKAERNGDPLKLSE